MIELFFLENILWEITIKLSKKGGALNGSGLNGYGRTFCIYCF